MANCIEETAARASESIEVIAAAAVGAIHLHTSLPLLLLSWLNLRIMYNPIEDFSFTDPFSSWWPFIVAGLVGILTTIRAFVGGPNCPSENTLAGKTVVITGGSSGIGLEVAKELMKRKAYVIIATRDTQATDEIFRNLINSKKLKADVRWTTKSLDLSSFASIRKFAETLDEPKVDILINNAGIAFHPFSKSKDGYEMHLAVNYLGHFLLTQKLLPKLRASQHGRVICTSSHVHEKGSIDMETFPNSPGFSPSSAFAQSKLALVLMARTLATSWQGTNVTINVANPGLVRGTRHTSKSLLSQSFHFRMMAGPTAWLLMKTPLQAAQTIVYLAVADEVQDASGRYFSNCTEEQPSTAAKDFDLGRRLHSKTLEIVSR